ncbi:MmcQ/YjbR family DNA-binding protein [Streptomyces sp. SID4919]|uniref:MmcQ-like protein n=1 Tax=Streptomyces uncialis TaxID=1048205 RepID=A0A1Q4UZK8_9ACTN|nr:MULTISPECIES: MmcQ/YjbR family DNA-binding protein [Streptomyces]MYY13523.1 MmcQ/YjbR family DNA-binding protein [Streptomyces sp. SID4919]OKH90973.1 MmcQ-like protein [Streptomyces uncialis]WST70519.1 MmcQ/YjbR family DNA-binding protein [Streptomyces uncialis]SCK32654.1 Predicted DNA-binding protein, MmcQ/YjbR family [Streptomyces sp. AmelKG-E11A]
MTPAALRSLCLSFNASVEEFPFGPEASVFKVLGKMFALSRLDARPLTVNLKCDPDDAVRLRAEHPGAVLPGYHMNKRHWNTVTVGELPRRQVRELVEDSYDLVVAGLPRAERLRLDRP